MSSVMDWPPDDASAVLSRALAALRQGQIVVLPTESRYLAVASVLAPDALASLARINGTNQPLALVLGQAERVFDWLPLFRGAGARLARRFWPGPLTLVSGTGIRQGVLRRLSKAVQEILAPEQQLALRFWEHPAVSSVAQQLETPLVGVAIPYGNATAAAQALGNLAALIIRDGDSEVDRPATVVKVCGRSWQVVREGAIPAEEINDAAPCRIVFLCTGNTCRSPMAEALCRRLLADNLKCDPNELFERGFLVQSAGLAAMMGQEATPEAVQAMGEMGAELTGHASQPINAEIIYQADHLFAMTASHLRMLEGIPGIAPQLLAREGVDVDDPIGGPPEVYRHCAARIKGYLQERLPELLEC